MSKDKILIVEDERITAEDLKNTLQNLGYEVSGIASSAESFYNCIQQDLPDLVLMDIYLKGDKDGIQLAEEIKEKHRIPVIYLTAFSDTHILERAKATEPFGYILKPFQERELHSNIEMALHKNRMEKRIAHLNNTLRAIHDVNQLTVRASSTEELLKKTCETLISTRAYNSAFFILLTPEGKYLNGASSGLDQNFKDFEFQLQNEKWPSCLHSLKESGKSLYASINTNSCFDCGLFCDTTPLQGTLIAKVQYQDRLYGYLSVSLPIALIDDTEEHELVNGIVDDLGLALNNLEQQKKRVAAEDALRESETNFRHSFDYAAAGLCIVGMDGKFIKTNPSFRKLVEYSEDELIQMHYNELTHPEDTKIGIEIANSLLNKNVEKATFEKRYITKSEKIIHAFISVSLVFDELNLPKYFITHITDSTQHKLAEQELQRLSQVILQSPESIIVTNTNGIIEYVNPATCSISGYSKEELIGQNPSVLKSGDTRREEYKNLWSSIKAGHEWKGEFHNRKKNGELYWERASISPIKNEFGEITHYLGIKEDITQRKHFENIQKVLFNISKQAFETNDVTQLIEIIKQELSTLIDTKNFYVAFLNETNGMLTTPFESDENDTLHSWPAEKSLTGYVIKNNKPALLTSNDVYKLKQEGEIELVGTPSKVWLGVPLTVDGKSYGAIAVQDYNNPDAFGENELKMLEFIASQLSLSIQRQRSILELQDALLKAEAGNKLKTAFINNISHEIRTPLNGILGFTEMTLYPDSTPEDNELYYTVIKKSSKRLLNTVTNYMDISLIVSGTMEMSKRPSNINKLFDDIYNEYIDLCKLKCIDLKCIKPENSEDLILHTDIEKLRKTLTHLLDNAIKFTSLGSITYGYKLKDNCFEFFISDTGTGINPESLTTIFSAFMQGDVSSTRGYEGSGLGLTIANGLVNLLGGKLMVNSEKGNGSTFHFTIPLADNPIISPKPVTETPKHAAEKMSILVAEDDDSNYKYIEIVLQYASYHVIRAENGIEAIECCRQHDDIQLVLMDIKMPLMDGFEATRQIRSFLPNLPIIALTAHVTPEDEKAAIDAGCNEYVTKPVSKAKLLEIIEYTLATKNL